MLTLPDFNKKQIVLIHSSVRKKIQFSNDNLVLRATETNEILNRVSCHKIFAVFLIGDITLTSVILKKAVRYGFSILFMGRNFKVYNVVGAETEGNSLLRKKQYHFTEGFQIAKQIVRNKLKNQIQLLKKIRRRSDEEEKAIEIIGKYKEETHQAESLKELLGIEGYPTKVFFKAYFGRVGWKRRSPRSKQDELNLLLDIGYTHLFSFIECNLRLYGFDIYKGVYHTRFYERKSLVCDLVEPFRCVIDRALLKAFNLNRFDRNDFTIRNNQYFLNPRKIEKYTGIFFEEILKIKVDIFKYVQGYYRAFMKELPSEEYPVFEI